jgi:uncharacterized protein (TIGR02145 family)
MIIKKSYIFLEFILKLNRNYKTFFFLFIFCFSPVLTFSQSGFFPTGGGLITYDANNGGNVNSYNFGTNIGVVQSLFLRGGMLHTWKNGAGNICGGEMFYRVYKDGNPSGAFSSLTMNFSANHSFTTTAVPTNISSGGTGDQRWENTGLNLNVLSLTNDVGIWVLEVYFRANTCNGEVFYSNFGNNFQLRFEVTGFDAFASAVNLENCQSSNSSFNLSGDIVNRFGTVDFQSSNLGTFFANSAQLKLIGGQAKTYKSNVSNVCVPRLFYRVYPSGSPSGSFSILELNQTITSCSGCPGTFTNGSPCNGFNSCNDQLWQRTNANIDLISLAGNTAGIYMLEVYYEIPGSVNSTSNCSFTKFISNFGANFTASFTIIDQVVASNTGPYCVGETIQLNSNSATSPNWSGPVSFSNTNQNPTRPSATEAMSGLYTLTSTLSNGCSQNATTVVSVSTSASATNDGALCVGQTLILASSSGTSYSWLGPNSFTSSVQNPTVSASATAAMAGTYNVSIVGACGASGGVVDNFSDGNFTVNPVWTVQQGGIVSSSNFLKGNNTDTDDIISTPSTQIYGTWHFDYRFHTTAFTSSGDQFVAFFITSTNAGLQTSNGYYVYVESSGQLLLRRRNGGSAATTIITSSISGTSELNTNWHTIKVIRGFSGQFELYFDGVLKGIGTDNTYTTSTHLGPWIHGKFATDNHEVDNISCSPPATATTTVVVNTAPSITSKTGTICSGNTYTMSTASPDVVTTGTTYSWSFTANPNITGATTGTAQSSFTQTLTNTSGLPQTIVYAVTPTVGSCSGTPFTVTITVDAPLNGGTVTNNQIICAGVTPTTLTSVLLPSGGSGLGITGSIQIGTQIWMNSNLNVVNYNDGTPVGTVFNTTAGAYTWYQDSYPTWGQYYGALYNWYAVNTGKLCPFGWHVPTLTEYTTLINLASGSTTAGKKLKSCRTVSNGCATTIDPRWDASSSAFGTDDYGFAALPAGREYWNSGAKQFERVQTRARFWTSTLNDPSNARAIEMNYNTSDAPDAAYPYGDGYSVRCMGDNATTIQNSYTYQWQQDPGCTGTWSNISGATSLTYSPGALTQTTCFRRVTIDACGTAFSNTITITVNPGPSITPMTATICSGQAFSVTPVNGTNGTVPIGTTYMWSAPVMSGVTGGTAQATAQTSISQTLANSTASNGTATYTVTATSGTCTSTFTVTVTVLPPLVAGTVQGISSGGGGPGHLVISQVYGGGGNSGSLYTHDFVELFNPTASTVNLSGWSLQYTSATGTGWGTSPSPLSLSGSIQPGSYFLVQMAAGAGGSIALPTPDQIGTIFIAGTAGKIALVNSTTALSGTCPTGSNIIDFVGFGTTANCSEGSSSAPAPSNSTWITRALNGCQDTQVNSADFTPGNTITPRNSASPTNFCTTTSLTETICANTSASSITASAATGSSGSFTYQWYSQAGNINCPIGTSTTGWTLIPGANGLTYSPGTVASTTTFALFIMPTGAVGCTGTWATDCRKIVVNPAPIITDVTTSVCSGSAFTGTPINGTNGTVPIGTTYSWSAPSGSNFTGGAVGSSTSTINGTLTLSSGSSATAVYTVTPSLGSCSGNTFTVTVSLTNCAPPTPFTACNLVVYEIGDGTTLGSSSFPVKVKEITPSGVLVQTISSLFTGTNQLTQSGASSSTGFLNSYNGFLAVPGLNSSLGTLSVTNQNTKVTHILNGNATLTTRTLHPTSGTMPFTGENYRSVVPVSASSFYCSGTSSPNGTGGIWYYDGSTFTQIFSSINNLRNIEIFNGNLYFTTGSGSNRGLYQVGSGLPTTSDQSANLILSVNTSTSSPYDFSISPDGCTIYLTDDGNGGDLTLAGIYKFQNTNGTWTNPYKYTAFTRGLVVDFKEAITKIYATTSTSSSVVTSDLIYITDNGSFSAPLWTLPAGLNYAFAGIDFTPNSTTTITNPITTQPLASANLCNTQTQTLSVANTGSATYQWYSNSVNSTCGATAISGATTATYTPPATVVNGTAYFFVKVSVNCTQIFLSNISAITTTITTTPTASNNSPICLGGTLSLATPTVSGATYSWTGPNSFNSSTQNPTVSTNATSAMIGTYSVTTTVNGCTSTAGTTNVTAVQSPSINALSPP